MSEEQADNALIELRALTECRCRSQYALKDGHESECVGLWREEVELLARELRALRAAVPAAITAEDVLAGMSAWDAHAGDRISDHEDENLYAAFIAEHLNRAKS